MRFRATKVATSEIGNRKPPGIRAQRAKGDNSVWRTARRTQTHTFAGAEGAGVWRPDAPIISNRRLHAATFPPAWANRCIHDAAGRWPNIGKRTAAFWHSAPGSAQELSRCTPTRRAGRIARFTKSNPELPGGAVSPLVDPGNSTTGTANATCRFRGQMLPGNRPPHFLAFERFQ